MKPLYFPPRIFYGETRFVFETATRARYPSADKPMEQHSLLYHLIILRSLQDPHGMPADLLDRCFSGKPKSDVVTLGVVSMFHFKNTPEPCFWVSFSCGLSDTPPPASARDAEEFKDLLRKLNLI